MTSNEFLSGLDPNPKPVKEYPYVKFPVYFIGSDVTDMINSYRMSQEEKQARETKLPKFIANIRKIVIETEIDINQSVFDQINNIINQDFRVSFSLIPKIPKGE